MRIYRLILCIYSCLFYSYSLLATGQLEIYNNHPDPLVYLIANLDAFTGDQYGNQPGPCFLVSHGMPFMVDSNYKSPTGDLKLYEHTQINPDPFIAQTMCNQGSYPDPIYSQAISLSPSDTNIEIYYGEPSIKTGAYEEKKKRNQLIELPIAQNPRPLAR